VPDVSLLGSSSDVAGIVPATCVFGPCEKTRRDLDDEYRWEGLSLGDSAVLSSFLAALVVRPDELHTHIPVGGVIEIPEEIISESMTRMVEHLYPRRVDAALRFGSSWWILELKPSSRMAGLGQLLSYYYWWCRDCGTCRVDRLVLVCEDCDGDEVQAYEAAGVDVAVV